MKHIRWIIALTASITIALAVSPPVCAQDQPADADAATDAAEQPLSVDAINAKIEATQSATDLDPAVRDQIVQVYQQAIDQLNLAASHKEQQAQYESQAADAPQRLTQIQEALAQPAAPTTVDPPDGLTLDQADQRLTEAQSSRQAAQDELSATETERTRRGERRTAIPELLSAARQEIENQTTALSAAPPDDAVADVTEASRVNATARLQALRSETAMLEAELASYDARRELISARRDLATRQVAEYGAIADAWQQIVQDLREAEAQQATRQAEQLSRQAAREHPVLQAFAERSAELAGQRSGEAGVTQRIAGLTSDLAGTQARTEELRTKFRSLRRRMDTVGLNRATGLSLRREYEDLESASSVRRLAGKSRDRLEDVEFLLIDLEDDRDIAGALDSEVSKLLAAVRAEGGTVDEGSRDVARELITARRDILDQLIADFTAESDLLITLEASQREQANFIDAMTSYIEERILWVRSIPVGSGLKWGEAAEAFSWFTDRQSWGVAAAELPDRFRSTPLLPVAAAGLVIALFVYRFRAHIRLRRIAEQTASYKTDRIELTWLAALLSLLAAAPWPLAMILTGLALESVGDAAEQAGHIGFGLVTAGRFLVPLALLREIVRADGLGEAHFRWRATAMTTVRKALRWFTPIATLAVLLGAIVVDAQNDVWSATYGRVAVTVVLASLAIFSYRVFKPNGPTLGPYLSENATGWVNRLRKIWWPFVIGFPLVLILAAWFGYFFTVVELFSNYEMSLWVITAVIVLHGLAHRWLFLARRRLALQEAMRRREAAEAAEGEDAHEDDVERIDVPAISARTKQLFLTGLLVVLVIGLYSAWSDVLPALRMLDRVQVWPSVRLVEPSDATRQTSAPTAQQPVAGDSPEPASSGAPVQPITPATLAADGDDSTAQTRVVTLGDVGYALIVLLITYAAMKHAPAFIEIVILQRLPMDAGARYALSTVIRYAIVLIGLVVAFQAIGISWSSVQWLAAALTFGLAFGLQEIFANFISGLIILAERPIRVGDTVTVGGISGTVSRIRMRATMLTDWDRKELVIPNKTFITTDVINWSLTDPLIRARIPVGVSYGSDVDKVRDLLLEVAGQEALVIPEPEPVALFLGFGDSTLNFELRAFVGDVDDRLTAMSNLCIAITKTFREHDIEIAFPQRDLHIRSADALKEAIHKPDGPTGE